MLRRFSILGLSAFLMIVLIACGGNKVDDATADTYIKRSKNIITLLNESNYEEVYSTFNENMKEALPISELEELRPIIKESGEFEEITKRSVEEQDGIYITTLVAQYSEKKRIYTISYNDHKEVVGLFIK